MANRGQLHPESEIRAAIAAERREIAAVLDELPGRAWDEPSLCTGWRVREVAAHMSLGFRYSFPKLAGELVKARGSLDRMTDRCARRDAAEFSTTQLAGFLRDNAHHPWKPPVGGIVAALGHDVVHGLDITVPLDVDRRIPRDRLRMLLSAVDPKSVRFFGARLDGVELRATDLDWTFGAGAPLSGSAQDLLLVTYGRKLPSGRLDGPDAGRFTLPKAN
ncbi:maleylpyruvate isomerase family mycothiol-dependent enzyme [Streptomyces alkaliterrae]|uniref:Maleylpyruvate isomerase family mycothiol-dependent enzyme n=1 Tax=Streptomyces alkaliterrae TaxID=2213162 RepID=A0A5P0YPV2_9ACTN|nr:maleylpyruvate isomerase family mycothiol-dependent enzyme [Streptomyces alkaliterrae]MBB1258094.1 maleylpyruvate isomerase family mycothiol-dependent enzyme [Streptomyces alkaliterrae]MQS00549.1 maleylpyruvate isomerase family mycothiol-dependent enzyme [Streptomyces alkaliterrae]